MIPKSNKQNSLIHVDRAIAEIRQGRMILLKSNHMTMIILPAEGLDEEQYDEFISKTDRRCSIAMPYNRASSIGISVKKNSEIVVLSNKKKQLSLHEISTLSNPLDPKNIDLLELEVEQSLGLLKAGLSLMKYARLFPIFIFEMTKTLHDDIPQVLVDEIFSYPTEVAHSLRKVSEATVPLRDIEKCRIIAFRPSNGGLEHLAIVIGSLDQEKPVLTRIHSECFTGDLLDSLRCDCGGQLKKAIDIMKEEGGGIILYLAQEGRGIGLVNKLHSYQLQDRGLDTLEANQYLGFEDDERNYFPASVILKSLGINKIKLLTNNPHKVTAMKSLSIDVVERISHKMPSNKFNKSYLETKAKKSGHFL
jgi:GTP cyclohydrolase II